MAGATFGCSCRSESSVYSAYLNPYLKSPSLCPADVEVDARTKARRYRAIKTWRAFVAAPAAQYLRPGSISPPSRRIADIGFAITHVFAETFARKATPSGELCGYARQLSDPFFANLSGDAPDLHRALSPVYVTIRHPTFVNCGFLRFDCHPAGTNPCRVIGARRGDDFTFSMAGRTRADHIVACGPSAETGRHPAKTPSARLPSCGHDDPKCANQAFLRILPSDLWIGDTVGI